MRNMRALFVLSLLAAWTGAFAQQPPQLLRYKFAAGQTDHYEIRATGKLPLSLNFGPEANFPTLILEPTINISLTVRQYCRDVSEDGAGFMEMTIPAMQSHFSVRFEGQPMDIFTSWENNRLKIFLNGQEQPLDENAQKLAQALGATYPYQITSTGQQIPAEETLELLAQLTQSAAFSGLDFSRLNALTSRLPEKPVAIGETWTVEDTLTSPQGHLAGRSRIKLVGYEEQNGVQAARIEGEGKFTMSGQASGTQSPMGVMFHISRLEMDIRFINFFDPEAGKIILSQADIAQDMLLMLTVPGMRLGQDVHLPATIEKGQIHLEMRLQPAE